MTEETSEAPKIRKQDIEDKIVEISYYQHEVLTICVIEMENGFYVVGKSCPVSEENYDEVIGEEAAYADAFNQIWALEAYVMKDYLYNSEVVTLD